jgi:hypothetical protein
MVKENDPVSIENWSEICESHTGFINIHHSNSQIVHLIIWCMHI